MVMVAVGLWAALKGGRALWAWPAAFVGLMLAGRRAGHRRRARSLRRARHSRLDCGAGLLIAAAVDLPVARIENSLTKRMNDNMSTISGRPEWCMRETSRPSPGWIFLNADPFAGPSC